MKKQIIISNYDDITNPFYAGGGARAVHETALRLSHRFQVTVLTGAYPGAKNTTVDGVTYERIGLQFLGAKSGQVLFQLLLPWYVKTKQYDLWLESFTPPFSTGLLQLFTRKPVIGLVHMLAGDDMKRKYKFPFNLVEMWGLKTYRHFITTSQYIAEKVQNANPAASVTVIPNGVEPLRLSNIAQKRHILYLGRIEMDQKGIDLLLQAYLRLMGKTSYRLVIAGSGEEKQLRLLKHQIDALGLTESVNLSGRVGKTEKAKLLQEAACVVIPSRFETFSLVALEAASAGVPIVSFRIPGLAWLPEAVGVKVTPFNTTELAQAMYKASVSQNSKKRMVRSRFAQQFSWNVIGKQYEAYLTGMLQQNI